MAIVALSFLFSGCSKDDETTPADPTVTITEGTSLAIPANTSTATPYSLTLHVTIDAPGKIKSIVFNRNAYLGETLVTPYTETITTYNNETTASIDKTDDIVLGQFHLGTIDKISYEFIITDVNDVIGEATFDVTMGSYTAFTSEIITGEIWKLHSSGKACWDLKGDSTVTAIGDNYSVKRYIINSDNINSANIESNFTGSWTSNSVSWTSAGGTNYVTNGNGIKYVKANSFDYTNAKVEKANYVFELAGTTNQLTSIVNPAVDDIYIAKKDAELYVIKITELNTTEAAPTKANTGVLRFTYKK
ncbi:hypothetical protein CYCD_24160 [Tenuifilaceae bacterium CYCD]|nr:hypothetical protein CYCD_24160 [Tenuifilaceae bacterium CYCD]